MICPMTSPGRSPLKYSVPQLPLALVSRLSSGVSSCTLSMGGVSFPPGPSARVFPVVHLEGYATCLTPAIHNFRLYLSGRAWFAVHRTSRPRTTGPPSAARIASTTARDSPAGCSAALISTLVSRTTRSAVISQERVQPGVRQTSRGGLGPESVEGVGQPIPRGATQPLVLSHHDAHRTAFLREANRRAPGGVQQVAKAVPGFPGGDLLHEVHDGPANPGPPIEASDALSEAGCGPGAGATPQRRQPARKKGASRRRSRPKSRPKSMPW